MIKTIVADLFVLAIFGLLFLYTFTILVNFVSTGHLGTNILQVPDQHYPPSPKGT